MDGDLYSLESSSCHGCAERDRRIAQLEARNAELERRVAQLEQMIEKIDRSSKRQAAPFSKGPPKAKPKKPGRKRGDDYGTKAYRAVPQSIDEEHDVPLPDCCPYCGESHMVLEGIDHQYQTEIPTRAIHRQFNIHVGQCAGCRRRVRGHHPLQTSRATGCCASQLGPDAQALIVHLNKQAGLSQGKIMDLFKTCFGITLTRGGVCQSMLRSARKCQRHYLQIVERTKRSLWATMDETGWRIGGGLAWLHVAVTDQAALYLIDRARGFEASKLLVGEDYAGKLIHDGWAAYMRFWRALHQACLAHLLRRCHEILESATRGAVNFPRQIKAILLEALAIRDQRDAGKILAEQACGQADELEAQIAQLCKPRKVNATNERFSAHLLRMQHHLFTFLRHKGIDATNWRAEQAIRPAVVNRKVWGGNRTEVGAEAQSILMSVWQTALKQGIEPMKWLSQNLRSPALAPSLLPAPSG